MSLRKAAGPFRIHQNLSVEQKAVSDVSCAAYQVRTDFGWPRHKPIGSPNIPAWARARRADVHMPSF
jgi:hypothetical protein